MWDWVGVWGEMGGFGRGWGCCVGGFGPKTTERKDTKANRENKPVRCLVRLLLLLSFVLFLVVVVLRHFSCLFFLPLSLFLSFLLSLVLCVRCGWWMWLFFFLVLVVSSHFLSLSCCRPLRHSTLPS